MKRLSQAGFTLIEVVVFIIVSSLLMSALVIGLTTSLRNSPTVYYQWRAVQLARSCMEYVLQQKRVSGYSSIACPSSIATNLCANTAGYTLAANVTCSTWNNDTTYKTVTVTVSGLASTSLSMQLGNF